LLETAHRGQYCRSPFGVVGIAVAFWKGEGVSPGQSSKWEGGSIPLDGCEAIWGWGVSRFLSLLPGRLWDMPRHNDLGEGGSRVGGHQAQTRLFAKDWGEAPRLAEVASSQSPRRCRNREGTSNGKGRAGIEVGACCWRRGKYDPVLRSYSGCLRAHNTVTANFDTEQQLREA